MTRTPLAMRQLPNYSRANETANMVSHIVGGALGVVILAAVIFICVPAGNIWGLVSALVYAISMIALYTVSSVYHGLKPCMAKKVMQVVDHCTIYMLIAGTYTPILLAAVRTRFPFTAWSVFAAEWLLAAVGMVFTAIDHKKYSKFAMTCYIGMGWLVVLSFKPVWLSIGSAAMLWIFAGGIFYTLGAVLYALGRKRPYLHSVFHIFVLFGSAAQAAAIIFYVL